MTRFFIDTEFIERGPTQPLYLISIGLVSEKSGEEYYAESSEFPSHLASPWVRANVFPYLMWKDAKPNEQICQEIYRFVMGCCDVPPKPEFWGYYADYDWVLFCQLFGAMLQLPKGWPMAAYDLRQWLDHNRLNDVLQPDDAPHHALSDARWIMETFRRYAGG